MQARYEMIRGANACKQPGKTEVRIKGKGGWRDLGTLKKPYLRSELILIARLHKFCVRGGPVHVIPLDVVFAGTGALKAWLSMPVG
jgi:hypothetical protein